MFANRNSLNKFENMQERALRFVLNDNKPNYQELIDKGEVPGIKIMTLRLLATEVYKCVNDLNLAYLNAILTLKKAHTTYATSITIECGLKSFRNYAVKLWNVLLRKYKSALNRDDFEDIIKTWNM